MFVAMLKRVFRCLGVLGSLGVLLACSACSLFEGNDSLPAYLELQGATIEVDYGRSFSSTLGIKDLWIERQDELIGIYRIPSIVPFLPNENQRFLITGGIFESGLSALRTPYPFWQPNSIEIPVGTLDTFNLAPTFKYFPDSILAYPIREGFERLPLSMRNNQQSSDVARLQRITDDVFQGNFAGRVRFTPSERSFELASEDLFRLPQRGNNDIYAEITYKNNIPFTVGLRFIANTGPGEQGDGVLFNSQLQWNTIYVHLNPIARSLPEGARFQLFIKANGTGNTGEIIFDNIRLIHFKENP